MIVIIFIVKMLLVYKEKRKQTRNNDNSHKNLALVSTKKLICFVIIPNIAIIKCVAFQTNITGVFNGCSSLFCLVECTVNDKSSLKMKQQFLRCVQLLISFFFVRSSSINVKFQKRRKKLKIMWKEVHRMPTED